MIRREPDPEWRCNWTCAAVATTSELVNVRQRLGDFGVQLGINTAPQPQIARSLDGVTRLPVDEVPFASALSGAYRLTIKICRASMY